MRLHQYLSQELTFVMQRAADKRGFLQQLVQRLCERLPELDAELLLQRLLEREEQVTTGIGHAVAIPHAVLDGLERPCCVVVQIPEGQDYESLDGSPVHVLFMLLSPPGRPGGHIRLLARIARLADREDFVSRVATATTVEQLLSLILEEDQRHV